MCVVVEDTSRVLQSLSIESELHQSQFIEWQLARYAKMKMADRDHDNKLKFPRHHSQSIPTPYNATSTSKYLGLWHHRIDITLPDSACYLYTGKSSLNLLGTLLHVLGPWSWDAFVLRRSQDSICLHPKLLPEFTYGAISAQFSCCPDIETDAIIREVTCLHGLLPVISTFTTTRNFFQCIASLRIPLMNKCSSLQDLCSLALQCITVILSIKIGPCTDMFRQGIDLSLGTCTFGSRRDPRIPMRTREVGDLDQFRL